MKRRMVAAAVAAMVALGLAAGFVPRGSAEVGATRAALAFVAGSELRMDGKSTMHDWGSRTQTIQVVFLRAADQHDPATPPELEALMRSGGIRGVEVQIPVATLHSEKAGLDRNMLKSLQAEKYPVIRFRMLRYTTVSTADADTLKLRVEGVLTVTNAERPVTLDVRAWKGAGGEWIEGSEPLRMSDFGIKPPSMMLGALKVADGIDIHYRLLLAPGTVVAGPQPQSEK